MNHGVGDSMGTAGGLGSTRIPGSLRAFVVAVLLIWGRVGHAQGLGGFLSPGPLAEPHADLDTLTGCTSCHQAGKGVSAAKCLACHDEVEAQVLSHRGFHADKGATCQPCHLDHRGRAYAMVRFDESTFDHGTTGFPLRGGHSEVPCSGCHPTPGEWTGQDPACTSCHDDPHGTDASTRALDSGCTACHTEQSWRALPLPATTFDHDLPEHAAFALEGAHAPVACEACHPDWRFVPTAHEACTTCHQDPHRAPLSDDCATCHTVRDDWRVPRFDHAATGYPLQGVHRDVTCRSCHTRGVIRPVPHQTCASCHQDPHGGQFAPRPCDACHSVTRLGFALSDFDHTAVGWPLEGRHADATCASCHGSGPEASYAAVSRACTSCHEDPHAGRFAPAPCDECHTPVGWTVASFDHGRTDFVLTGAHTTVACASCHPPHVSSALPHDTCVDCHEDDPHDATVAACTGCHTTVSWADLQFDHASQTAFSLAPRTATPRAPTAMPPSTSPASTSPARPVTSPTDRPSTSPGPAATVTAVLRGSRRIWGPSATRRPGSPCSAPTSGSPVRAATAPPTTPTGTGSATGVRIATPSSPGSEPAGGTS